MLEYDRLVELFTLDWDGWFYNRFSRGRAKGGERAGYEDIHGYRRIVIDYKKYYEHHLVWFYVHGEWPNEIDHIDGNRANNAPANLRLCTRSQNCANSERGTGVSGLKGAYWNPRTRNWFSKIQIGTTVKWLGTFNSPEEAHLAFVEELERHHGEFAYHSRNP